MRPAKSISAKLTLALSIATLFLVACKGKSVAAPLGIGERGGKHELPLRVEYDRLWATDYAANANKLRCSGGSELCEDEGSARAEEADFAGKFLAAFESDSICSGIVLHPFGPMLKPSETAEQAFAVQKEGYWAFSVNFVPQDKKQSWNMVLSPAHTHYTSGEDDAHSMAHTVCSVVKETGGTVVE